MAKVDGGLFFRRVKRRQNHDEIRQKYPSGRGLKGLDKIFMIEVIAWPVLGRMSANIHRPA